jgi:hypothetical protein
MVNPFRQHVSHIDASAAPSDATHFAASRRYPSRAVREGRLLPGLAAAQVSRVDVNEDRQRCDAGEHRKISDGAVTAERPARLEPKRPAGEAGLETFSDG